MELVEMIQDYEALLEEKEHLAAETKRNNEEIRQAKEAIADYMIDENIPSISVGDYAYGLKTATKYNKRGEEALLDAGIDFFPWLEEVGLGDLIKPSVDSRTLNKAITERVEASGGELPEELAVAFYPYEYTDISRTKSRRKR